MNDLPFQYRHLHADGPSETARAAVHLRLHRQRPGELTEYPQGGEDWSRLFKYMLWKWRGRTRILASRQTPYFAREELHQVRNCQPFGLSFSGSPEGATPYICGHPEICPWCAAREAAALHLDISLLYQPYNALCRLLATSRVPATTADDLRPRLKRMRKILGGLSRANAHKVRFSYWLVSVEPALGADRQEYLIRGRWLALLCSRSHLVLPPTVSNPRVAFLRQHKLGDIQQVVSEVCAYPTGLLQGPRKAAALALEARFGLQLTERVGAYHAFDRELVSQLLQRLPTC